MSFALSKNVKVFVIELTGIEQKGTWCGEEKNPWSFNLSHGLWLKIFFLDVVVFMFDYYDRWIELEWWKLKVTSKAHILEGNPIISLIFGWIVLSLRLFEEQFRVRFTAIILFIK